MLGPAQLSDIRRRLLPQRAGLALSSPRKQLPHALRSTPSHSKSHGTCCKSGRSCPSFERTGHSQKMSPSSCTSTQNPKNRGKETNWGVPAPPQPAPPRKIPPPLRVSAQLPYTSSRFFSLWLLRLHLHPKVPCDDAEHANAGTLQVGPPSGNGTEMICP